MILRRRGLEGLPQDTIACGLGLVVPPHLQNKYPCGIVSDDSSDWGVHPQSERSGIDLFLLNNHLTIFHVFVGINQISRQSVIDFLSDNLLNDNDIIVGYDYATAFNAGTHTGHVSLVSSLDTVREVLGLIDPEESREIFVPANQLLPGILRQRDGFWIFGTSSETIITDYA